MDRYYVYPQGDSWAARKGEDEMLGEDYPDRGAALNAVYDHRGDVREDIYRKNEDGGFERLGVVVRHRGPEAVWLLRADESVYGEVDAEIAEGGGTPIIMNIAPINERSNAGEV